MTSQFNTATKMTRSSSSSSNGSPPQSLLIEKPKGALLVKNPSAASGNSSDSGEMIGIEDIEMFRNQPVLLAAIAEAKGKVVTPKQKSVIENDFISAAGGKEVFPLPDTDIQQFKSNIENAHTEQDVLLHVHDFTNKVRTAIIFDDFLPEFDRKKDVVGIMVEALLCVRSEEVKDTIKNYFDEFHLSFKAVNWEKATSDDINQFIAVIETAINAYQYPIRDSMVQLQTKAILEQLAVRTKQE